MEDKLKRLPKLGADWGENFQLWTLSLEALSEEKGLYYIHRHFWRKWFEFHESIDKEEKFPWKCSGSDVTRAEDSSNSFRRKEEPIKYLWEDLVEKCEELFCKSGADTKEDTQYALWEVPIYKRLHWWDLEAMDSAAEDSLKVAMMVDRFWNMDYSPYGTVLSAFKTISEDQFN